MKEAVIDSELEKRLQEVLAVAPADGVVGYQLSSTVYAVRDIVTSSTPHGWVHVYKTEIGKLECSLRYFKILSISKVSVIA